jgi:hemerythrin
MFKLDELKRVAFSSSVMLSQDILQFLKDWWLNHILTMDQDYAPYVREAAPS